tara:strand:+ start:8124 stop:8318 length:195 start_codon:yes stop_codon:yes gene_type:complete
MPKMYKQGCDPIIFHESNFEKQFLNGWTLEPHDIVKKKKKPQVGRVGNLKDRGDFADESKIKET